MHPEMTGNTQKERIHMAARDPWVPEIFKSKVWDWEKRLFFLQGMLDQI